MTCCAAAGPQKANSHKNEKAITPGKIGDLIIASLDACCTTRSSDAEQASRQIACIAIHPINQSHPTMATPIAVKKPVFTNRYFNRHPLTDSRVCARICATAADNQRHGCNVKWRVGISFPRFSKKPPKGGPLHRAIESWSGYWILNSSRLLPSAIISVIQRGVLPRPDHVSDGSFGFRYFGSTLG